MRKKVVETCEMCSRETKSPTTIKVEGAVLRVCSNCTSFGNVVDEPKSQSSRTRSSSTRSGRGRTRSKSSSKGSSSKSKPDEDQEILIDNYGVEIKRARMKKKLKQEELSSKSGVSVAYIRSIESENMRPTDKVARKLEQVLGIKLFEKPDTPLEHRETSDKKGLTVGDIVSIKHYDYD